MISISIEEARTLLANFTDARNVGKQYWFEVTVFGLPLNTSSDAMVSNYRATVTVSHSTDKNVTLHNVQAAIPGKLIIDNGVHFLKLVFVRI